MSDAPIKTRKKLIEVALPLDAINAESLRRKQKAPKGWPMSFHKWWAQRPLAASRAVIFAQMVDDPTEYTDTLLQVDDTRQAATRELKKRRKIWDELPEDAERGDAPTLEECAADLERERLFRIIEDLILWDNTGSEYILQKARAEIWKSWRRACADNAGLPGAAELFDRQKLPEFHDPFAGSGAIPLSAQWLGIETHASDLNPVAVLINKALLEIPARYANQPPINAQADENQTWKGAQGLADDVRFYGRRLREEAEKLVGHLYPKILVTRELASGRPDLTSYIGRELTVTAWLWARTVKSPNPAFHDVAVPLASTFVLSSKAGREAWVEPIIEGHSYRFEVKSGGRIPARASKGTKSARGANFTCVMSSMPIDAAYTKSEAQAGRMGTRLLAIVADGDGGRVYLSPTAEQEAAAEFATPSWIPDTEIAGSSQYLGVKPYGIATFAELFTRRQLAMFDKFYEVALQLREEVRRDGAARGVDSQYADAICIYLNCVVDRMLYYGSTLSAWLPKDNALRDAMPRQAIAMSWDFAESNPFGKSSGDTLTCIKAIASYLDTATPEIPAYAYQKDCQLISSVSKKVFSTDPPYYDNVPYSDLSDFFYVWLRRGLREVMPDLFSTISTPKAPELVAFAHRHQGRENAEKFFLTGMTGAMHQIAESAHPAFPTTIYYAFKQAETDEDGAASTGWETFLEAVLKAGFAITGTWPMRTEGESRMRSRDSNALASSIVLVCRPRSANARSATRREFLNDLKSELPAALHHLQRGNIAPVDLAQAAIGPGMGTFTRYAKVLDADGKPISVREALARINEVLDEVLAAQEGDFDPDTRWAVTWFDQFGFDEGDYGTAETLSKAKATAVAEMADLRNGGIVTARAGKVKLTRPADLPEDWDPDTDPRLTVWEMVHHLIRRMDEGGEGAAAELLAKLGVKAEAARELAYRLVCSCGGKRALHLPRRTTKPRGGSSAFAAVSVLMERWPRLRACWLSRRKQSNRLPPTRLRIRQRQLRVNRAKHPRRLHRRMIRRSRLVPACADSTEPCRWMRPA